MTPEQKARRLAAIEAGLREKEIDTMKQTMPRSVTGPSTSNDVDREEMEFMTRIQMEDSDDDPFPTSKRKRLIFKEEEKEVTLPSTPPGPSLESDIAISPTPRRSSHRIAYAMRDRLSSSDFSNRDDQRASGIGDNCEDDERVSDWETGIRVPGGHYNGYNKNGTSSKQPENPPSLVNSLVRTISNVFQSPSSTRTHAPEPTGEEISYRTNHSSYPTSNAIFNNNYSVVLKGIETMNNMFISMETEISRLKEELALLEDDNVSKSRKIQELENEVKKYVSQ